MYKNNQTTLSNGLRVVTVEMPHLHTTAFVAYCKIGSRYETKETNGISHFLEHMLFRGTKTYPDSYELNDAVEVLGGSLNATTYRDYTYFDTRLPAESLHGMTQIIGEIFTSPRFVKLDTERKAILEEMSSDLDDKGRLICVDSLSRLSLFPDHPLGFPIIGTKKTVESFSQKDIEVHFQKFYKAKNMVLCAAGPVSHQKFVDAAEQFFSPIEPGEEIKHQTPTVLPEGPSFRYTENQSSQTQITISFRTFGELHPNYPAIQLLWRILDDGMGARLHRRIYDDLGLAYEISAGVDTFADISVFDIDAAVRHKNAPRLIKEVLELLKELVKKGITEPELQKAKRRYALDINATLDSPEGMAGWFGGGSLLYTPEDFSKRLEKINRYTTEDLQRIASEIFYPKNLYATIVGDLNDSQKERCQHAIEHWK